MDKKSKQISGLKAEKIVQKANKYFSEAEKHFIIKELLSSRCTKSLSFPISPQNLPLYYYFLVKI